MLRLKLYCAAAIIGVFGVGSGICRAVFTNGADDRR